jgi:glycosyltransferase involved in cell wall biosynthesis
MPQLSGVVIAQDEERDLPRCLRSMAFCDELLVVDGGSRDRTVEAAHQAGARVVEHAWPGYSEQRRFALSQVTGDYVLSLDADEWVSDALREAIVKELAGGRPASGYELRVQNWFSGRWLRFGGRGHDYHLRLFRREAASYPDRRVHEGVEVRGEVRRLSGPLFHESYADLSDYLRKIDRYSTLSAEERQARGARFSPLIAAVRLPIGFFRRYLLQLGFLDGYAGFLHAVLAAYGDFLKLAKLRELQAPAPARESSSMTR